MRILLVLCFLLSFLFANAQNGYNCFYETNRKANWEYLGPTNGPAELDDQRFGQVACFVINPKDSNEIFIGSPTGSLLHTSNRGQSWKVLTDDCDLPIIGVNDIIVDFNKTPYHILIATGSENEWYDTPDFGIFKSTDGGFSWKRKNEKIRNSIFSPVYYNFIEHRDTIFCLSRKSIVYSADGGENWNPILTDKMVIGGLPLSERELRHFYYEPSERKIYFSNKQKWTSRGNESARLFTVSLVNNEIEELTSKLQQRFKTLKKDNGYEAIQMLPYKPGQLLIAVSHYNSPEMYFYEYNISQKKVIGYEVPNAGKMATSLHWMAGVRLNKINSNVRYLAGVYLYKSTDGGQSYKKLFGYSFGDNGIPHVDIRSMAITKHSNDGESDHIYLGTDGGLSFSDDGGKTFRNLNGASCQLTQFYGLGSSPFNGTISAGSQDNSIMTYIPKTKKWMHNVRGDGYDVAYSQNKPGHAYGQYNVRALYETKNDVVPFGRSMRLIPQMESSNRKTLIAHPNGDLYFAAQSLFHLPKNSKKWVEYKVPQPHKALAIDVSISNPAIIYISSNWGHLYKTNDGGKTWEDISDQLIVEGKKQGARVQSICISPYDPDKVWIGLGYLGAYDKLCRDSYRILESDDGGKTWKNISNGLPLFSVHDIIFYEGSYESLFMATDQGIYFRRGAGYTWQRFSDKLPKSLVGELNINYCRGKLIAATYGRGLWETDLPTIQDKNPMIIRGKKTFTAPEGEALVINQDILVRGRCPITIDCPIYMPKGSKIRVRRKKQIVFTEKGKIINGCGEKWLGIVEK